MRARIAFALWVAAAAVVLLEPSPAIATGTVHRTADLMAHAGLPAAICDPAHVEALLNAGMFLPPAALALLGWRTLRWADVAVFGFVGSFAVELTQALFFDARSAQAIDVVANTSGALAGALLGEFARRRRRRA